MRARDVNAELGTSNREKRSHETLMIVASQETQFAEQVLFRNGGIEPTHRQTLLPTARRIFERPSPSIAGEILITKSKMPMVADLMELRQKRRALGTPLNPNAHT